jgi:hypothetical protein
MSAPTLKGARQRPQAASGKVVDEQAISAKPAGNPHQLRWNLAS